MVKKIPINPVYKKENGLWNLSTISLPFPEGFQDKERNIVYIPAGQFGGNHQHPRAEMFIGVGDELFIAWLDEKGEKREEKMMDNEQLYLFIVEPLTPHVVVNKAQSFALLVEFADRPNVDVEYVEVLGSS
ncbi:hypothetical protein EYC59_00290 [Candidatus Saccharibacteria bacterium]|nr:MAG: hypothetical protein EYC59_00290 [Candidatus Saccharibacteria bacterium]